MDSDDLIVGILDLTSRYICGATGETKFGLDLGVVRGHGYSGPMRALPRDTAAAIYRAEYRAAELLEIYQGLMPMTTVDKMIDGILSREGGYVNHPSDPGGATNFGITQAVARAAGYQGHMRDLPRQTAIDIYRREYVEKAGFLAVAEIDTKVAEELIDSGVNVGPARARLWFQQALNVLNRRQADYKDIAEDGKIGPASIAAFQALRRKRGAFGAQELMLTCLNGLQFMHYFNLAKGGTKFEDFMVGWVDHRIGKLA